MAPSPVRAAAGLRRRSVPPCSAPLIVGNPGASWVAAVGTGSGGCHVRGRAPLHPECVVAVRSPSRPGSCPGRLGFPDQRSRCARHLPGSTGPTAEDVLAVTGCTYGPEAGIPGMLARFVVIAQAALISVAVGRTDRFTTMYAPDPSAARVTPSPRTAGLIRNRVAEGSRMAMSVPYGWTIGSRATSTPTRPAARPRRARLGGQDHQLVVPRSVSWRSRAAHSVSGGGGVPQQLLGGALLHDSPTVRQPGSVPGSVDGRDPPTRPAARSDRPYGDRHRRHQWRRPSHRRGPGRRRRAGGAGGAQRREG